MAVVEPGEVSSAQEYDGSYFKTQWAPLVNILDPNIEAEGERERERDSIVYLRIFIIIINLLFPES